MEKLTIEIITEKDKGTVVLRCNGEALQNIKGFDLHFDPDKNTCQMSGMKLSTDRAGQYYVDPETKGTAVEKTDLLLYLLPNYRINERVKRTQQELEFAMVNIHDTSFLNTQKLFEQYGV